jgi:hypothetical protein
MKKTFKLNLKGDSYKVYIKERSKLTTIKTGDEEINFYFGNPKYIEFETQYLDSFLCQRLCDSKAEEIKGYILNAIK